MMSVNLNASNLEAIIAQRIKDAGGWIPFDQFMGAALYEPQLGYYESQAVFGQQGDFVTGAQLGPWLALGYADLIEWGWKQLGSPSEWVLLEQGGGTGVLLADVLAELHRKGMAPAKTIAVETSEHMRQRQQSHYQSLGLDILSVKTVAEVGEIENCLMICNELPDAFPVRCFSWKKRHLIERGVAHSQERFHWQDGSVIEEGLIDIDDKLQGEWPDGYTSEWNPNLASWQMEVAGMIKRGFLFCVDYGYSQQEYYRPQRMQGTLMGHRGHQVVEDVLAQPGSCDITAHIDFTTLNRTGELQGLNGCCFMSQGGWLAQTPSVQRLVERLAGDGSVESVQQLAQAKQMLMPFGMGETFKLFMQAVNIQNAVPAYLERFNRFKDLKPSKGVA